MFRGVPDASGRGSRRRGQARSYPSPAIPENAEPNRLRVRRFMSAPSPLDQPIQKPLDVLRVILQLRYVLGDVLSLSPYDEHAVVRLARLYLEPIYGLLHRFDT